ncbi:MAG: hypothetical protein ACTHLC_06695 [Rhizobiaceae bacterium]|jgi:hypothetical protein
MMNARIAASAAAIIVAAAIAGCQSAPDRPARIDVPTSPVDGEWIGSDGVAISSLHGGNFQSRSVQTGETLTQGTYKFRDQNTIDLSFYSVKTQQQTAAACLLATPDRMNCTLGNGTQFVLTRHS